MSFTVGSGGSGIYYALVNDDGDTDGLFSQYLLSVDVVDPVAPMVVSTSLGDEGELRTSVLDRLTLAFSEDLNAATVNDVRNLDLRAAGVDVYHASILRILLVVLFGSFICRYHVCHVDW